MRKKDLSISICDLDTFAGITNRSSCLVLNAIANQGISDRGISAKLSQINSLGQRENMKKVTGGTKVVIQESAEELKEKMNQQFKGKGKERLQALYLLKTGQCQQLDEVAAIVGRSRRTVNRWLNDYQEGGLAQLIEPRKKTSRFISEAQNLVSETQDFVSETQNFVPEAQDFISETQNFVPEAQDFVSETQDFVPEAQDFVSNIDHVIKELLVSLDLTSQSFETEVQIESSKLLNILRRIKRFLSSSKFKKNNEIQSEVEILISNIVLAFDALQENRNLALVAHIRLDAERAIRQLESPLIGNVLNKFEGFLSASSTGLKILIGLVLAIPLYIAIPSSMIILLNDASTSLEQSELISANEEARGTTVPEIYVKDFREGTYLMILSFIAGSTGSIISILSRVAEYNTSQYEDKYDASFLPIFIGLFKPIIGGAFGILVFAAMNTSLLDDFLNQARTDAKWFTVISVTFVVGFSERLAKDMIGQMEDRLVTNRSYVEEEIQ